MRSHPSRGGCQNAGVCEQVKIEGRDRKQLLLDYEDVDLTYGDVTSQEDDFDRHSFNDDDDPSADTATRYKHPPLFLDPFHWRHPSNQGSLVYRRERKRLKFNDTVDVLLYSSAKP